MKVEVVSIGTELLLSDVLDTNAAHISRSMEAVDAELIYRVTVGDDVARITDAFLVALERADVVLATGGLGPGEHDVMRAVAAATGFQYDADANEVVGSVPLGELHGKSSAFMVEVDDKLLFCLPRNRREVAFLLETAVFPYLQRQRPPKSGWLLLRTVGLMESSMRQRLSELPLAPNQQISFDSYAGQTNIRLSVEAESGAEIDAQLSELEQEVRRRLGNHIFGTGNDRLEAVILHMLRENGYHLAVIECYTDRFLSRGLAQIDDYQTAAIIFPFDVPEELAAYLEIPPLKDHSDFTHWCRRTAELLRLRQGVDLSLLVFKKMSPGGVQLSAFLSSAQGVSVTQRSFGGHPENINQWACTLGLAHLHRWLLAHKTG
jgi:nicotinamide-nucleotide amidase